MNTRRDRFLTGRAGPAAKAEDRAIPVLVSLLTMILLAISILVFLCSPALGQVGAGSQDWRLKIKEAVVVEGGMVTLADLAEPIGTASPDVLELMRRELFAAPVEQGRPMVLNRDRLSMALRQSLGPAVGQCLLPSQIVIQRGGAVLNQADLQKRVDQALAPQMSALTGEASLREYKLPNYIFLGDAMGTVKVETPASLSPGRVALRLVELAPDGSSARQFSGSVFLDLWRDVPAVSRPVQKGEALTPDVLTVTRKNAAYLKGDIWDGTGGPWMVKQPVGEHEPLYVSNLEPLPQVRKGSRLSLVFESQTIRLETPAQALADGQIGDAIPVRNLQSNKQIIATVVDHNTVRVR